MGFSLKSVIRSRDIGESRDLCNYRSHNATLLFWSIETLSVKIGLELYASSHRKQSCIFFNIYEFKSDNSGKEKKIVYVLL